MKREDLERLNKELRTLFPVLRDRLRQAHGSLLDQWLERGHSKAVRVIATDELVDAPFFDDDDIQESASELFYLDVQGFDGFHPARPLTNTDCEWLRQQIRELVQVRMRESGLQQLISEVRSGYYDSRKEDKRAAVFFIWSAIYEDGQSQELGDLWILEQSPDLWHDYMFLLEEGARLNQMWRYCADVLSLEILTELDREYTDIDEETEEVI